MDYFEYRAGRLFAENVAVSDILETVGSPAFIYSERTLLDHYDKIAHAFRDLGVERLEIFAEPRNRRSRAIPRRLGFRREGTLRHVAKLNDRFIDHVVYSLHEL